MYISIYVELIQKELEKTCLDQFWLDINQTNQHHAEHQSEHRMSPHHVETPTWTVPNEPTLCWTPTSTVPSQHHAEYKPLNTNLNTNTNTKLNINNLRALNLLDNPNYFLASVEWPHWICKDDNNIAIILMDLWLCCNLHLDVWKYCVHDFFSLMIDNMYKSSNRKII